MDFYVTEQGSDTNDGLTWWTAFRTAHRAAEAMPLAQTGGGFMARTGRLFLGPGHFDERALGPLHFSRAVRIIGAMASDTNEGGTVLDCDIEPEPGFAESSAWLRLDDLSFRGQLTVNQGGFGAGCRNVAFGNTQGWGLRILGGCNDFYLDECTAGGCRDGWIYVHYPATANLGHLKIRGGQVDSCGAAPVLIDCDAYGVNYLSIADVKFESNSDALHNDAVHYRPIGGSNGLRVTMSNCIAWRGGVAGRAMFYSAAGPGGECRFLGINLDTQNYASGPWHNSKALLRWPGPHMANFSWYGIGSYQAAVETPVGV